MTIMNSGGDFFKAEKNPRFSGRKHEEVVQGSYFMSSLPPGTIKLIH